MKNSKLLVAVVAVSSMLGIGAASAADLPMRAMPYAAPAPVFSWTGCYVGVHAGAGVLLDQGFQQVGINRDRHGVGGLAGGQLGCNYQTGMLVLGIEGEGFWSGMKVTQDQFDGNILFASASIRNKWDYDVAARIGIAFDRHAYAPHVRTERSGQVRVTGARPLQVRADAQDLGMTPASFTIHPKALLVVTPELPPSG